MQVANHRLATVLVEIALIIGMQEACAVPSKIADDTGITGLGEILHKGKIPILMLCHAMNDLNQCLYVCIRMHDGHRERKIVKIRDDCQCFNGDRRNPPLVNEYQEFVRFIRMCIGCAERLGLYRLQ